MPNPKKKTLLPLGVTAAERQNWTVKAGNFSKCPQCGASKMPHRICPSCGFYNGELIIPKKDKKEKDRRGQQPQEEKK